MWGNKDFLQQLQVTDLTEKEVLFLERSRKDLGSDCYWPRSSDVSECTIMTCSVLSDMSSWSLELSQQSATTNQVA